MIKENHLWPTFSPGRLLTTLAMNQEGTGFISSEHRRHHLHLLINLLTRLSAPNVGSPRTPGAGSVPVGLAGLPSGMGVPPSHSWGDVPQLLSCLDPVLPSCRQGRRSRWDFKTLWSWPGLLISFRARSWLFESNKPGQTHSCLQLSSLPQALQAGRQAGRQMLLESMSGDQETPLQYFSTKNPPSGM